ncbi:ABC transporter permease [Sphingopyxis sp. BSNA05]|uniref:cell division protein FtsX n=1 Tax=Sphingopyxis sp. BSNA05 TaxID=1236614 RepID=UPI001C280307|nr:FtsX-like permease family protein [Sphingopyxis sp. BSNA05]
MIFLTVLAAAAGLAMNRAISDVSDELSSRATVQIIEANPEIRSRQAAAAAERLRALPLIEEVRVLPPAEIEALIEPWLGTQDLADDIPLPALIDLKLVRIASEAEYQSLRGALQAIAPGARVEPSSGYIAPVIALVRSLQWIAFGLVGLLALATGAAVIISARSALNTHGETIAVVHLLGGTDQQISRLFQRRIALDALLGGLIGLVGGTAIIWLISIQLNALGSGLVESVGLDWWSWLIIAAIPILGMFLAMVTARLTVIGALKKIL